MSFKRTGNRIQQKMRRMDMKKYRGWVIALLLILLCIGGVRLVLRATAEYPALGEPVSYPVNQVEGFTLSIETPTWSPFRGYTIRWAVSAESEDIYTFSTENADFSNLERCVDGQWYRLKRSQDMENLSHLDFPLGGDSTGLQGSIVQKFDNYGTRLEPGTYRVTLEMQAEDGTPHYLAAEFDIA